MSRTIALAEKQTIEFNEGFAKAWAAMEDSNDHVLITGKAGTGKSTLLNYFRKHTKKSVAVLAPTGVAALNIQGQTIHSFFGFRPDITPGNVKQLSEKRQEMYEALDAIVVDEASMVRADLLDCVDRFMRFNGRKRNKAFGGTQMIFVGDLYQLPPVVQTQERELFSERYKSPYFFDADCMNDVDLAYLELEKIYRQKDQEFIDILNAIRNASVQDGHIEALNARCVQTPEAGLDVTLASVNSLADQINDEKLSELKAKPETFYAKIKGDFKKEHFPTAVELNLKQGAQVMLLNNDSAGRWVNGSMGQVKEILDDGDEGAVLVEFPDGSEEEVTPHRWDVFHHVFNAATGSLGTESVGSFTQLPLRLAWAVTIHKSQGKTFDRVRLDLSRGLFVPGQLYVALSRCRTLEGITLTHPVNKKNAWVDWRVVKFSTSRQYEKSEKAMPLDEKIRLLKQAAKDKAKMRITYLKSDDSKSVRDILPKHVASMTYMGKAFQGVEAYCFKREEDRVFRVDRILELKVV